MELDKEVHIGSWLVEKLGDAMVFTGAVGLALAVILYASPVLNLGLIGVSFLFLLPGLLIAVIGYRMINNKGDKDETAKTGELLPSTEQ